MDQPDARIAHAGHTVITIRAATIADAALYTTLAADTFRDTFGPDNTPENMALHLASTYGKQKQHAELADPRHIVFFAEYDAEPVGYGMLRHGPAPECVRAYDPIEIARIYAVKARVGSGIGAALMQHCLERSAANGNDYVWLGVWEHNVRAIAFYRRWGFEDVGSQPFEVGRDRQTDRVMMRRVAEEV